MVQLKTVLFAGVQILNRLGRQPESGEGLRSYLKAVLTVPGGITYNSKGRK